MKKILNFFDKNLKPSIDWIIKDNNPLIRYQCENLKLPLNDDDINHIKKMVTYIDICYYDNYKNYNITPGVAIAAIQIGWLKKVIYVHFNDENNNEIIYLIANPIIIDKSEDVIYLENGEGCLSVPENKNGIVPRASYISVDAYDLINNQNIKINLKGYSAIVLQHEIDHLNGILYYDHINIFDPNYINEKWKKI